MDDSGMDWHPTTPPQPFNPYGTTYMPGGWLENSPPRRTTNIFARHQPPSRVAPIIKRVCTGLHGAYRLTAAAANAVAIKPLYEIAREAKAKKLRARSMASGIRVSKRRVRRSPPPMSQSPWGRAVAFIEHPTQQAVATLPASSDFWIMSGSVSGGEDHNINSRTTKVPSQRLETPTPTPTPISTYGRRSSFIRKPPAELSQRTANPSRNKPRPLSIGVVMESPFRILSRVQPRVARFNPSPPDSPSEQLHTDLQDAGEHDCGASDTSADLESHWMPEAQSIRSNVRVQQPTPAASPDSKVVTTVKKEELEDLRVHSRRPATISSSLPVHIPIRSDTSGLLDDDSDVPEWDPIQDKAWRKMLRSQAESSDALTGRRLPIDGVISPDSQRYNDMLESMEARLQGGGVRSLDFKLLPENKSEDPEEKGNLHTEDTAEGLHILSTAEDVDSQVKTPGGKKLVKLESAALQPEFQQFAKLSIADSTPKANIHSKQKVSRLTRAAQRKIESEKESELYKITRLTTEWEDKVKDAVRNGHGKYAARDFARVVPQYSSQRGQDNWLNDEVINGYLTLIANHGKMSDRPNQVPSHHAFNSFLYKNLVEKGHDSVKRWATRAKIGGKNLLETEQVYFPINSGMHWTLCILEAKAKKITVYNSLGFGGGDKVANAILNYVRAEVGSAFDEDGWILDARGKSPQQNNSDDCGVFTITSARQLMLKKAPDDSYSASDIPTQRKRIVAELINGGLLKSEMVHD